MTPTRSCRAAVPGWRGRAPHALAATVLAALAALPACGGLERQPQADSAVVERFASRGYLAPRNAAVITDTIVWSTADTSTDLALTRPADGARHPLVVYLPGLGQDAAAASRWVRAWAQDGYAVLALQPLAADALAWTSPDARRGEFEAIARRRYGAAAMTDRLQALDAILAFVQARVAAGDARFGSIDLAHVAIAGFDLGAYTAMAVAGAPPAGVAAHAGRMDFQAVLVLSPYPGSPAARTPQQFDRAALPALWVSGRRDADTYGLVAEPGLRSAPFASLPVGSKYLLLLADATHALIGGVADDAADAARGPVADRVGRPAQATRGRNQDAAALRGADDDGDAGTDGNAETPAALAARQARWRAERAAALTAQAEAIAALRSVTTAFLDAAVRAEPAARQWLDHDAAAWLGSVGSLQAR